MNPETIAVPLSEWVADQASYYACLDTEAGAWLSRVLRELSLKLPARADSSTTVVILTGR